MGADLMISVNEMKLTKDQAIAKARKLVAEYPLPDLLETLESCGCHTWSEADTSNPSITPTLSNEVVEYLIQCVETVYTYSDRRDCAFFTLDGNRRFAVTGGMSWGDEPTDVWLPFVICEVLGLTVPDETAVAP